MENKIELLSQTSTDSRSSADDILHDGIVFLSDCQNFTPSAIDVLGELDYEDVTDSSELEALKEHIINSTKPFNFAECAEEVSLQHDIDQVTKTLLDSVASDIHMKRDELLSSVTSEDCEDISLSFYTDDSDAEASFYSAKEELFCSESIEACDAQINWFDEMPAEIVQHIFSFLGTPDLIKTSLVSKHFYTCCNDPLNWQKLDLSDMRGTNHMTYATIERYVKKSPLMKDLNCSGMSDMSTFLLELIAENCPLLEKLNISFVKELNIAHFEILARHFSHLKWLNVEGCDLVDDSCIDVLCSEGAAPGLQGLNLCYCSGIAQDNTITSLAINKPCLKFLNIDGIPWITDRLV